MKTLDIIDVVRAIAKRHGVSGAQISLAWLLAQPALTSVITGVKRLDQLNDNPAAVDLELSEEDLKRLDDVSRPAAMYPGWIQTHRADGRVPRGYRFPGKSWGLGEKPVSA